MLFGKAQIFGVISSLILLFSSGLYAEVSICSSGPTVQRIDSPAVTGLPLALFVVGLNHNDRAGAGHSNPSDVENVAVKIKESWKGDPASIVVLVSETGGCDGCGQADTVFSSGAGQTLANKLHALFNAPFDLRRGFPAVPDPKGVIMAAPSIPAVIAGSGWSIPGSSSDSIGKDYKSQSLLRTKGNRRYARVVIQSRKTPLRLGLSIVHLTAEQSPNSNDNSHDRKVEIEDVLREIAASSADVDIVAGDFNQRLDGVSAFGPDNGKYRDDDLAWVNELVGTQSINVLWHSGGNDCLGVDGSHHTVFTDIMNLVVIGHNRPRSINPIYYFSDSNPDGLTDSGTLRAPGIKHGVLGLVFSESCSATPAPHTCGPDDGCGRPFNRCSATEACALNACVYRDPDSNCPRPNVVCWCDNSCISPAQCEHGCRRTLGPRNK